MNVPAAGHGTATLSNGRAERGQPGHRAVPAPWTVGKGVEGEARSRRHLPARAGADRTVPRRCSTAATAMCTSASGSARSATRRSASVSRDDVQHLLLRLELRREDPPPETRRLRGNRHRRSRGADHRPGRPRLVRRQGAGRRQGVEAGPGLGPPQTRTSSRRAWTRSRSTSGQRVEAAKGERSWATDQRHGRPSAEPQLARRFPRGVATSTRHARRRCRRSVAGRSCRRRTSGGTRSRRSSRSASRRRTTSPSQATTTSSPTT